MNKKATISVDMTFLGISLAIAFVVVGIFLFRMAPTDVSDTAVCESSIQLKNAFNVKDTVNILPVEINCKIQYVCFTSGMLQNCNDNFGAGEKVKEINVGNDEEKLKEELAKLQYTCWKTLGQGKLDYYPRGFDWKSTYCSPCYIFAFSKELNKEISEIKYIDYFDYLARHNTPGGEEVSYLYYLYRIVDPNLVFVMQKELLNKSSLSKIDTKQKYAIMSIISKDGWGKITLGATTGFAVAAAGVTAAIIYAPVVVAALPMIAISGTTLGLTSLGGVIGNAFTKNKAIFPPAIVEYDSDIFNRYSCQMDFIK
jgi:hypothetical protein